MKKGIIYARVSTEQQEYDRQIADLQQYAKVNNIQILHIYSEKLSGVKSIERPEFDKITQLTKEDIDIVLVWELSRLSRRSIHLQQTIQDFIYKGIEVYAYKDNFNTHNPDGSINQIAKMVLALTATIAENEADTFKKRTKAGIEYKIQNEGYSYTLRPPFGYKKDKGKLVIDEEKADIVREIFNMSLTQSTVRIKNYLNATYGFHWHASTVHKILSNSTFKGYNFRNGQKFNTPAIVSEEVWKNAQENLKLRNARSKGQENHNIPYLLRGLLVCGCCGRHYTHHHDYYCPVTDLTSWNSKKCKSTQVKASRLDSIVWNITDFIFSNIIDKEYKEKVIGHLQPDLKDIETKLTNYSKSMDKAVNEASKLHLQLASINIEELAATVRKMIRSKEKEILNIKAEIDRLNKDKEVINRKIDTIKENGEYKITGDYEQAEFLDKVIDYVKIEGNQKAKLLTLRYKVGIVIHLCYYHMKWFWSYAYDVLNFESEEQIKNIIDSGIVFKIEKDNTIELPPATPDQERELEWDF